MKKSTKQRSCVGCRKKADKSEFLRIVFFDKKLVVDTEQKLDGRGCYLCLKKDCLTMAIKRNAFNYRLKQKVSKEELARFRDQFEKYLP